MSIDSIFEPMEKKKFLVHITGPGCSGKSSLAKEISDRLPGIYYLGYDKLKWQLSGYDREEDRELIHTLERGLLDALLKTGTSVVTELYLHDEAEYKEVAQALSENGYFFVAVALNAPEDVLLSRFRQRVKDAAEKGTPESLTDESAFLDITRTRKPYVVPNTPVFDTSVTAVEHIAAEIAKTLSVQRP